MGARTKGLDVSSWQHPAGRPIEWEAVRADGCTFVLVKATQGTSYVNPWFERDAEDAFAAGLLVGAFHYFDPSASPELQAKHFCGVAMGHRLEIGTWLDFEPAETSQWTAAGWVNQFLAEAGQARDDTGLYCDLSWHKELTAANVTPRALWLAAWGATDLPGGVTLWQAEVGVVQGVPGEVDIDYLVGTRSINLPTSPPPKPTAATTAPPKLEPEPEPEPEDLSAKVAKAVAEQLA